MDFWSTKTVTQHSAVNYWAEVLSTALQPMNIAAPKADAFKASLMQFALGPTIFSRAQGTAQFGERTPAHISRTNDHFFNILYTSQNPIEVNWRGGVIRIEEGQGVICDSEIPSTFALLGDVDCVSLQVTERWLRHWLPVPGELNGRVLQAQGWGAVLSAAMQNLAHSDPDDFALPGDAIADQLGALIALSVGRGPQASAGQQKLLARLKESVRERCHEQGLCAEEIAQMHRISRRYLHSLFAASGTTFGESLMTARLEQAISMLQSPHFGGVSINDIAWRCGFSTPGHFARRFRQRFDVSPSRYRATLHS